MIRIATAILFLCAWLPFAARADDSPPDVAGAEQRTDRSAIYAVDPALKPAGPVELSFGPHLFLDDYWIDSSANVTREVHSPQRDPAIPNPLVTGREDANFQPYMTVLRERANGRFRIWYGARREDLDTGQSHLATMESEDGIHWKRPHRILDDPGPIAFGVSLIDDGARGARPDQRFKYAWWYGGGLHVAASPDGYTFTPLFENQVVLAHNHDINGIYWDPLREHYLAIASTYETGPTWSGQRRVTLQSTSDDLQHWRTPWYVVTPEDSVEQGETQFYAMDGFLARGDLLVGMVKVLHDDFKADDPPDPADQYGVGWTSLAWSRDGVHWVRDREPFFAPDPRKGQWDHAHAWIDEQLPVGDQIYLYYGGYARGHKVNRFEERQIGLVTMSRDRYVARSANEEPGFIQTPVVIPRGGEMTLNLSAAEGEARVQIRDANGEPLAGFTFVDCEPIQVDALDAPVRWKGNLSDLRGQSVRLEFRLQRAKLFAFGLR